MKWLTCVAMILAVVLSLASPALVLAADQAGGAAATEGANAAAHGASGAGPNFAIFAGAAVGAGLGAALTIIGAGYGMGRIGSAALESMARQPEVAGRIQTAMIIIAALLEGVTFFSLIVCILIQGNTKW